MTRPNVIHIEPKREKVSHRQQTIILTYVPDTHTWKWRVEFVVRQKLLFDGVGKRRQDALRLAKKQIDLMTDGE